MTLRHLLLVAATVSFTVAGALVAPALACTVFGVCLVGAWYLLAPVAD